MNSVIKWLRATHDVRLTGADRVVHAMCYFTVVFSGFIAMAQIITKWITP